MEPTRERTHFAEDFSNAEFINKNTVCLTAKRGHKKEDASGEKLDR
jgi:hypothetical protein